MNNLFKKSNKRFNIPLILAICFFLSLLFVSIFGSDGIIKISKTNIKLEELKKKIQLLEKENMRIKKEIQQLKTDPYYTEKVIREELGLVKPGEKVYEFIDEKKEKKSKDTKNSLTNK